MGIVPIRVMVNIPESLARSLMNVSVTHTKLSIGTQIAPTPVNLSGFETEKIEKDLPDRVKKDDKGGHIID